MTGTSKISTSQKEKTIDNHYDIPKCYYDIPSNNIKQSLNFDKSIMSELSIQPKSNDLIDDIDFDDVENTNTNTQNNNNTSNNSVTKDKVSAHSYAFFLLLFFASAYSAYMYKKNETKGEAKKKVAFLFFFAIHLLVLHIIDCFCLLATRIFY